MEQDKGLKFDYFQAWDDGLKLVQALWFYICQYYGRKVDMPKTCVAFMPDKVLKKYLQTQYEKFRKKQ